MSKKTPKPAWDRRNKAVPAPYAPSTFEAPAPRNNIRNITNYLIKQIAGMGMSIKSTQSRISKSQYLEVDAGKRRFTIRISDHALRHGKKHDFNIYTENYYEKSWHYMDFIKAFRALVGEG